MFVSEYLPFTAKDRAFDVSIDNLRTLFAACFGENKIPSDSERDNVFIGEIFVCISAIDTITYGIILHTANILLPISPVK